MTTCQVACPNCRKDLRVVTSSGSRPLRCPWCKTVFQFQVPSTPAPGPLTTTPPQAAPVEVIPIGATSTRGRFAILAGLLGFLILLGGASIGIGYYHLSQKNGEQQADAGSAANVPGGSPGTTARPSTLPGQDPPEPIPGNGQAIPPDVRSTSTTPSRYDRPDVDPPNQGGPGRNTPVPQPPAPVTPDPDPRPPVNPPPVAPRKKQLPPELQKRVDQAIERGVAYLKVRQSPTGRWELPEAGHSALAGLALLECGVGPDDPVIVRAARCVRDNVPTLTNTYEIGLTILFLDRLGDRKDEEHIQSLALRLIAAQKRDGGWRYDCPPLQRADEEELLQLLKQTRPRTLKDLAVVGSDGKLQGLTALREMPDASSPEGNTELARVHKDLPDRLKHIPALQPPQKGSSTLQPVDSDNSCTQFAALGLWAARRHGVHAERALALIVTRFRTSQSKRGGWGYHYAPKGSDSQTSPMTCAGLLGLAVGHGLVADKGFRPAEKEDPEVLHAFSYLKDHIGTPQSHLGGLSGGHWNADGANLYYLWSIERVGMLFGVETIGGKDWYGWGVQLLLPRQKADGSWYEDHYPGSSPTADTSFALLFLRRVNFTPDLSRKLEAIIEVKELK